MKRRVFFSFNYNKDNWRASQVRNIGVVEGNRLVSDNEWEKIKGNEFAIKQRINDNLKGCSCTVVLIGQKTYERKRVSYEIAESWNQGKGVLGIYIHNLKDREGNSSKKGKNPFEKIKLGDEKLSNIVKVYDAPYSNSKAVYDYIASHIELWIEDAIKIREKY